ncbi:unnamed protein product [Candida verbasci]|uniref:Uncharacterized protein n=1 Tax=Candida verbasci TaxID=1227364 RepID=A0A9W4U226_9ASCO|nr:unnamed protein product [Candida verbasci]
MSNSEKSKSKFKHNKYLPDESFSINKEVALKDGTKKDQVVANGTVKCHKVKISNNGDYLITYKIENLDNEKLFKERYNNFEMNIKLETKMDKAKFIYGEIDKLRKTVKKEMQKRKVNDKK